MGIQYGQQIAEQTLRYISSPDDVLHRLMRGWSEISVPIAEDLTPAITKRRDLWIDKYLKSDLDSSRNSSLTDDEISVLRELFEELVSICVDIIEENSKLLKD